MFFNLSAQILTFYKYLCNECLILPAQLCPTKPGLQSQIPVDVSQIPFDGLVQSSGQVRSKNERDK